MYELALFAGAGGGILGGKILGWRTVCAVEIEKYPCGVLMQRQNDGSLPAFPVWDDITTFRADNPECSSFIADLKRVADKLVISGGFPCQDISVAGKGKGISGERSGLWGEMWRLVCEIRPALVYVENSPMLTSRGIDRVLGQLSEVGYNAIWGVLGADDVGANHGRKRIWIMAYANNSRGGTSASRVNSKWAQKEQKRDNKPQFRVGGFSENEMADEPGTDRNPQRVHAIPDGDIENDKGEMANPGSIGRGKGRCDNGEHDRPKPHTESEYVSDTDSERQLQPQGLISNERGRTGNGSEKTTNTNPSRCTQNNSSISAGQFEQAQGGWWAIEPGLGRVVNGMAHRVDRLKAIGNGQVPACMAAAFSLLNYIRKHITQCSENTK